MLYHIPPVAMVGWSAALIGRLRDAFPDVIIGMKDSSGDAENTLAMIEAFPGFAVFPGAEVYLQRALKAAGVTTRRPWHSLRHGFAHRVIPRGLPLPLLGAMLGHSSSAITVDIYGHVDSRIPVEVLSRALER